MAHTVESRITTPASELRERLDKAERQLPSLDTATVAGFLSNLDRMDVLFDQLAADNVDVRSEAGRWDDLQRQIARNAGRIVKLANGAGGYAALRTQNPPATAPWWQLDAMIAARRRRQHLEAGEALEGELAQAVDAAYEHRVAHGAGDRRARCSSRWRSLPCCCSVQAGPTRRG